MLLFNVAYDSVGSCQLTSSKAHTVEEQTVNYNFNLL